MFFTYKTKYVDSFEILKHTLFFKFFVLVLVFFQYQRTANKNVFCSRKYSDLPTINFMSDFMAALHIVMCRLKW